MRVKVSVVLASVAAGLTACGSDDETGGKAARTQAAPASSAMELKVDIATFKYKPEKAVVSKGAKLTFVNADEAPHTATAKDKSFDTKRLNKGQSKSVTVDKAGTFTYFCAYHRFMQAQITVK